MSSKPSRVRMGGSPAELARGLLKTLYGQYHRSLLTPIIVLALLHILLYCLCLWVGLRPVSESFPWIVARNLLYLIILAAWWQLVRCAHIGRKLYHGLSVGFVATEVILLLQTAKTILADGYHVELPLFGQLMEMLKSLLTRLT